MRFFTFLKVCRGRNLKNVWIHGFMVYEALPCLTSNVSLAQTVQGVAYSTTVGVLSGRFRILDMGPHSFHTPQSYS